MKTSFSTFVLVVLVVLTTGVGSVCAEDRGKVPYEEILVSQVKPVRGCNDAETARAVALPAVFGGILVDWFSTRMIAGMNRRMKEKIRAYSAAYNNRPVFVEMFSDSLWTTAENGGESCVIMQRVECQVDEKLIATGKAACDASSSDRLIAFSVAIWLKREQGYLRVLPSAFSLAKLKAKSGRGNAAVAAMLRIEAVRPNTVNGGSIWRSEEAELFSLSCVMPREPGARIGCNREFNTDSNAWKRARVLPMPPDGRAQAIVISIGEAGDAPRATRLFSEFLDENHDAISGALSEAIKKKLSLAE